MNQVFVRPLKHLIHCRLSLCSLLLLDLIGFVRLDLKTWGLIPTFILWSNYISYSLLIMLGILMLLLFGDGCCDRPLF